MSNANARKRVPADLQANYSKSSNAGLGSEDSILARIDRHFSRRHPGVVLGRGDDCAELRLDSPDLAVSSDIFLENVHFRRGYFTPEEIGHKALAVNLSDLAAAGARPLGFVLNLMLPPDLPPDDLEGILSGMGKLAKSYDLPLCGGDLSKSKPGQLGFVVTIWGGPAEATPSGLPHDCTGNLSGDLAGNVSDNLAGNGPGNRQIETGPGNGLVETGPFLRRGQAQAGDYVFIIGAIGLARLGLLNLEELLHASGQSSAPGSDQAPPPVNLPGALIDRADLEKSLPCSLQAHLRPQPQVSAGLVLARFKHAHPACRIGLMDLSDGLYRDLPRLLGKSFSLQSEEQQSISSKTDKQTTGVTGQKNCQEAARQPQVSPVDHIAQVIHVTGVELHINPEELHPELLLWQGLQTTPRQNVAPAPPASGNASDALSALVEHACLGGEDYALLGTCSPEYWERLKAYFASMEHSGTRQDRSTQDDARPKKIGVVTATGGLYVNGKQVHASGFDHFS